MTPPTAIEIVRAHVEWMKTCFSTVGMDPREDPLYNALAPVLRDAERFQALGRALEKREIQVYIHDGFVGPRGPWCHHDGTLAELADKLRSEK
jgi:hypothetical protein